jgi:hypothetical protein
MLFYIIFIRWFEMVNQKIYYSTQSAYTNPGKHSKYFPKKIKPYEEVFKYIKNIIIHPMDAKTLGIKANYKEVMRQHVFHRTAIEILEHEKIKKILSSNSSSSDTLPAQRAMLSCDHVSVLFTSILRERSVPIRSRVVFSTYIVKDKLIPHWISEIYDEEKEKWRYVDPERQKTIFSKKDIISPGKLWLEYRANTIDNLDIHVGNHNNIDAVKYELINDINCIMKNELLYYDWMITHSGQKKPQIAKTSYERLGENDLELLDSLALLSLNVDANFDKIDEIYNRIVQNENKR